MPAPIKIILLAEDSPQDVEMTITALAAHHLVNEVVVVNDGQEALDFLYRKGKFENRPPGLPVVILLDLKMPKVDGIEVLRVIKSDPALKTIPVVMLTSSNEEHDILRSYLHGTNAYVVKPVGFRQFVEAVKQLGVFWTVHNEPPPV